MSGLHFSGNYSPQWLPQATEIAPRHNIDSEAAGWRLLAAVAASEQTDGGSASASAAALPAYLQRHGYIVDTAPSAWSWWNEVDAPRKAGSTPPTVGVPPALDHMKLLKVPLGV